MEMRNLSLAALALFATGCATLGRDTFIREKTGDHLYEAKLEELWPQVTALFFEEGFVVKQTPGEHLLETEWKEEMMGSRVAGYFHRYLAAGVPLANGRSQVRIYRHSKKALEDPRRTLGTNRGSVGPRSWADQEAEDSTAPGLKKGAGSEGMSAEQFQVLGNEDSMGDLRQRAHDPKGDRDFAFELRLMKKLDPESANEIEQEATRRFGGETP